MTENKRFVKEKSMPNKFVSCIMDNEKYLNYGELENTLNALHEEIQQLRKELKSEELETQRYIDLAKTIDNEKKELKQQLADVDRLIDEKIEEYLNIPSLCDGALTALKELKNELKGDFE